MRVLLRLKQPCSNASRSGFSNNFEEYANISVEWLNRWGHSEGFKIMSPVKRQNENVFLIPGLSRGTLTRHLSDARALINFSNGQVKEATGVQCFQCLDDCIAIMLLVFTFALFAFAQSARCLPAILKRQSLYALSDWNRLFKRERERDFSSRVCLQMRRALRWKAL